MQQTDNVIDMASYRNQPQPQDHQQLVDEIGARAYSVLHEEALKHGLNLSEVIAEQLLGLSLVMEEVEGADTVKETLSIIANKVG